MNDCKCYWVRKDLGMGKTLRRELALQGGPYYVLKCEVCGRSIAGSVPHDDVERKRTLITWRPSDYFFGQFTVYYGP